MEQNTQEDKNKREVKAPKFDAEGELINVSPKKSLSKKTVALILTFVALIVVVSVYFLFLNKKDDVQLPKENGEIVKKEEVVENKKAEIDKNIDTDQDKLPDYLEKILGTSESNPDTDGDSYNDLAEIKNGYDPLSDKKYTEEEWDDVKEEIKGEDEGFYENVFGGIVANPDFVCGTDTVKDIDNNIYNTVKIGEQCWLKENLKVTIIKNLQGKTIANYCPDNDVRFCMYGRLYDWDVAMNGSITEGAQGICPDGWHIPKDSEWYVLENSLTTNSCSDARIGLWDCDPAGEKLKNGGSSEFEGFLTGGYEPFVNRDSGSFSPFGRQAYFWSSTENGDKKAWYRILSSTESTVARNAYNKSANYSVRCLKD